VKQGTFHSDCLPDGYYGKWKHRGHEHTLTSVFLSALLRSNTICYLCDYMLQIISQLLSGF